MRVVNEVFQFLDFVSEAVYVDLKYDYVFAIVLIVLCEWVGDVLFVDVLLLMCCCFRGVWCCCC